MEGSYHIAQVGGYYDQPFGVGGYYDQPFGVGGYYDQPFGVGYMGVDGLNGQDLGGFKDSFSSAVPWMLVAGGLGLFIGWKAGGAFCTGRMAFGSAKRAVSGAIGKSKEAFSSAASKVTGRR